MPPFVAVLDNIRSLQNVGSIFRTADALGIRKLYLCGITGTPPDPKIAKTALGAEQWIEHEYAKYTWRVADSLKEQGYSIIALEQDPRSVSLEQFAPEFPIALVIGNEVQGITKGVLDRADTIVHIPMQGRKESLNAAVTFGIAGYEIARKGSSL